MKTFEEIAVQTDIYGVDNNEELEALFNRALDLCKNAKTFESDVSSTQFVTSDNVTYCITNVESVDLQPVPLVEVRIENQDCMQATFTAIPALKTDSGTEVVELADSVSNITGDKDSSTACIQGKDDKKVIMSKMKCPVCSKEYLRNVCYHKHLKTHPELGHSHQDTVSEMQATESDAPVDTGPSEPEEDLEENFEQQDSSGDEYHMGEEEEEEEDDEEEEEDQENSNEDSATKQLKETPKKRRIRVTHKCEHCKQVFTNKRNFQRHERSHTRPPKLPPDHICPYCDRDCKTPSALQRHIPTHTHEKNFKCNVCEKAFSTAQVLKIHTRCHTGDTFKCSYCNKEFVRKAKLKEHLRIHTDEKPYKCKVCGEYFRTDTHPRRHAGDRLHKCPYCDKGFVKKWAMEEHKRTHTGEKPFKCEVCGKTFRFKNVLKGHETLHTGIRPYNCNICGKGFVKQFYLDQHKRDHTGEKPFTCSHCDKTFKNRQNWRLHEKRHVEDLAVDTVIASTETTIASNEIVTSL